MKRRQRTVYLVTIAAMFAMVGGYALASTTVTTLAPPQSSNVTQGGTLGGFSTIATVTSEQLVVVSVAMAAAASAGAQGISVGLSGTTTQLAVCGGPPCASQSFKAATPAATIGDYGEQITLNVFQSAANSAIGFDMAMTIVTGAGTVVAFGYVQVPTSAVSQTIPVYLFVDLGTIIAPIVSAVSVVFNQCSAGTTCP